MYEDDDYFYDEEEMEDEDYYEDENEEDVIRCANCGAVIEDPDTAIKVEKYGEVYYFCSEECKEEYGL